MYIHAPNQTPTTFPYSFAKLKKDNPGTSFPDKPSEALLLEYDVYPVQDDKPAFDPVKQKLIQRPIAEFQLIDGVFHTAYDIVSLTKQEFNNRQRPDDRMDQVAINKLLKKQFETMTVPDEEIDDYASLFPAFRVGETITQEMIDAGPVRRQHSGVVWEVLQPHTTQLDWLPPDVPALWKRVYESGTIQLWVQPTGSHDAYSFEDKVYWPDVNTTWISTVAGTNTNTWEPGVYGWEVFTG